MNAYLTIIMLNWNNFKDTLLSINSIIKHDKHSVKIYLIDNGSDKFYQDLFYDQLYKNEKIKNFVNKNNIGFTKANNKALREILDKEKHVFLLNNDTIVSSNLISVLNKVMNSKNTDMLSCRLVNYFDHKLLDNAGHKMLTSGEIIPIGHGEPIDKYKHKFENIGACAGAALYSTKMLGDIGLFDEYFVTGYEDSELGLRAFIAGYKCEYEPKAIVYHKMGQSVKKIFDYNYVLKTQTNIYYTYLKLVHWQVMSINLLPNLLRFFIITFVNMLFFRWRYFKIQYHSLYIILFKDWKKVMKARKESKRLRRIPWWKLLMKQEFFLKRDIHNFYKFIIKGEKSYFEKY